MKLDGVCGEIHSHTRSVRREAFNETDRNLVVTNHQVSQVCQYRICLITQRQLSIFPSGKRMIASSRYSFVTFAANRTTEQKRRILTYHTFRNCPATFCLHGESVWAGYRGLDERTSSGGV
jgi:hypothetical protein